MCVQAVGMIQPKPVPLLISLHRLSSQVWSVCKYNTTVCHSFSPNFHATYQLLAGIDATGLDPDLDCHHLVVNDWHDLEASQNVCIISIPTVFDKSLAPAGKATIHAYVAANEPYGIWEGLDRKSKEYQDLKVKFLPMWSVQVHGAVVSNSLQQRLG